MPEENRGRRPIVAANWKMNIGPGQARKLTQDTIAAIPVADRQAVEVVLCPPSISLWEAREGLATGIGLGAQNMHWRLEGALTGEIAPPMVAEICTHVIIGHSERRQHFGETDDQAHQKVRAALEVGLWPILCVGESLQQRQAGQTNDWVALQVRGALHGASAEELARIVVAYEPIWAIGTGVAASGDDANAVAHHIRQVLRSLGGMSVAEKARIQYGGSVTAANASEFVSQPDIDGALVGGASLKPLDFAAIVHAAAGL